MHLLLKLLDDPDVKHQIITAQAKDKEELSMKAARLVGEMYQTLFKAVDAKAPRATIG
jgi:hypothetical protein